MKKIKRVLKKTWIGKQLLKLRKQPAPTSNFPGSSLYWENRYKAKDTSGAGSYGRLAAFKADVINSFVTDKNIQTVVELGCGDGNQLLLANYPNYIGFDVSKEAIAICRNKFKNDNSKEFKLSDPKHFKLAIADLSMSLDVIYHLVEDDVFNAYMHDLFTVSKKYVIIYSSNYNDHFIAHVKCRKFTDWIKTNVAETWELLEFIENKYPFEEDNPNETSMADFYIYKKK